MARDEDVQDIDTALFDEADVPREALAEWGDPTATLGQRGCLVMQKPSIEDLLGVRGCMFVMRGWLQLSTDEISKEPQIQPTNAGVPPHRARLRPYGCMQERWFGRRSA